MHPDRFRGIFKSYIGNEQREKEVLSTTFIIPATKPTKMKTVIIGLWAGTTMSSNPRIIVSDL